MSAADALARLLAAWEGRLAIAVSGGVDSLTLAAAAHRALDAGRVTLCHAASAAVPAEATARTRALAAARGWRLQVIDAGELTDQRYLENPVNRCFWCKTDLYGAIRRAVGEGVAIASGTNTDDLGEYRPGLDAARDASVRHPFVEAGMDKASVRALASALDLPEVAVLPASPCLSSRIETGIAIDPELLGRVEAAERIVRALLAPPTVRCRIRAGGMVVELDADTLARLDADRPRLAGAIRDATGMEPGFAPYRNGSAFIRRVAS